jgi:hypothetical protein
MEAVDWILYTSVTDPNYVHNLRQLSHDELLYCLVNEQRKSSSAQLAREAKRRGLTIVGGTVDVAR